MWATEGDVIVMLNNRSGTNQPSIPTYLYDGAYSPWGYPGHPQTLPELNAVWSCPSGTPEISLAGAGRETVSFQVFITAGPSTALSGVSVAVTPLSGPGATIGSDNTQTSAITRYLEGYIPYTPPSETPAALQMSGNLPDPLIPFYDAYDSGNPAVATPFNVAKATTQGVWVNVTIPAGQTPGTYTGTVTVSGTGVDATIPLSLTVWNGTLPAFDAGSIDPAYADMLKSWMPMYPGNLQEGEGVAEGSAAEQSLYDEYLLMAHDYYFDTQYDGQFPNVSYPDPGYPSASNPTSFTRGAPTGPGATGTTSTIDWTSYDAFNGPSLTPGGLFPDGTAMRVFDVGNGGDQAWSYENTWPTTRNDYYNWISPDLPTPAGLLQLWQNYTEQISMHFTANQASKGWGRPELIAYNWDETYNHLDNDYTYQDVALYAQAVNQGNTALSPTWDPSTNPVRTFLTDEPACWDTQDEGGGTSGCYSNAYCADHINLSYPGGANASLNANAGQKFTSSWVMDWTPDPTLFLPGKPGPALNYDSTANPASLVARTGYEYTLDMTQGVPALSTAPAPIERWFYQATEPFAANDQQGTSGVGLRANFWIAYLYGLDVTSPSVGDPNPTAPAPGGVWDWADEFWGYGAPRTPSPGNCSYSPYSYPMQWGGGYFFYPGNELTCYNQPGSVGADILAQSLAVNKSHGITGPVPSIRMEQWRRGYEDYEYLYLLGKQSGRVAALAVVNTIASPGLTSWSALDWDNIIQYWDMQGVGGAEPNVCTTSGMPNGPTGAFNCPGLWTNNPDQYSTARVTLAKDLGFTTVSATPTVSSVTPSGGLPAGGTSVAVTGTYLTGATAVMFGNTAAAAYTVNSATQITAISPAGSGTVDVTVTTPNGTSATSSADQFTYYSIPALTSISPTGGPAAGNTSVTFTGTNLTGAIAVKFGSTAATGYTVNSPRQITATSPAGSGAVSVTVTTPGGTSNGETFTYSALAPTGLTATAGNASVALSWTAPSGAVTYNVYRGTTSGGESTTPIATGVATAFYTDTTAANGTKYYYEVAAVNGGGTSGLSNEASATPEPPAPASIAATAGGGQSAPVNTAFATALQATVRDSGNNPVSGATVTFTAPASGASGAFGSGASATATTNAQGVATAPAFTANGIMGSYSVTARVPGVASTASFALTNTRRQPPRRRATLRRFTRPPANPST